VETAPFEFPFTMECSFLNAATDGDKWEHDNWQCTLKRTNGETMNVVFRQGIGHRVRVFFSGPIAYHVRIGSTVRHTAIRGSGAFVESKEKPAYIPTGMTVRIPDGGAYVDVPQPPSIESVVSCIVLDSFGYENAIDFEEWANEYGYDADSREAFRIWEECGEQYRNWKRFTRGLELEPIEAFAMAY
jgi:hypothetical protein